jgi:NAD-dependent deacetylase
MLRNKIIDLLDLFKNANRVSVLSGAGVSTESGIPDFRSPEGGLWTKFPEYIVDINYFKVHPLDFYNFISESLMEIFNAVPSFSHYFLAKYEKDGKIQAVITQNIDSLHQKAGSKNVLELHGNMTLCKCLECGKNFKTADILERFKIDKKVPYCDCGGLIKPDVVFFGEMLSPGVMSMAYDFIKQSDLFIVLGSSLLVAPASFLPESAVCSGCKLVIINNQKTPLDGLADVIINDRISEVLVTLDKHLEEKVG